MFVVGVMKMGNIVPRMAIEPMYLASVLPLHHVGYLMSPIYPHIAVYAAPCLRGQCRLLHSPSCNCKSFNAYNYMQAMALHIQTQDRFKNHTGYSLYRIMVMAMHIVNVMKMGNIVPRAGIEPIPLAFWACVLALHHIGSLVSPLYRCLPVYAAPCLRGHCRLLHV